MAERKPNIFSRIFSRGPSDEDRKRLNDLMNPKRGPMEWDSKALASLSTLSETSVNERPRTEGADTLVDYKLLRDIANKSEVVNAIIRRCVDDTLSNGYEFVLNDGVLEGSEKELAKIREFFTKPNPDDMGDEWLETLLYDLVLFGDAYLECDGSQDISKNNGQNWIYGGDLVSIWPISAETMKLIPARQTPASPNMAYIQEIDRDIRRFSSDKVIHLAKFKQSNGYGSSPLVPLMETIAGQLNLSNYLNAMYTGTLPKTILNVGDISNSEMKAMIALIESQLAGGKSPFGLIAINGGAGFNLHRLIDGAREGAQLDMLYYYREEICAVFGIPPMKLGWVQTGKMANPEQQLDSWYDVVDSYHARLSAMINNIIFSKLGIADWKWQFVSIRPKRETERAETLKSQAIALATLRQEGAISINEAREILGMPVIQNPRAFDPFFVSPKLSINMGKPVDADNQEDGDEDEIGLEDLFPTEPMPEDEGEGAGDFQFEEESIEYADISIGDRQIIGTVRKDNAKEFEAIITQGKKKLEKDFSRHQAEFANRLLSKYNERFNKDATFKYGNSNIKKSFKLINGNLQQNIKAGSSVGGADITWAVDVLDYELRELIDKQTYSSGVALMAGFDATLAATAKGTGLELAFGTADAQALDYWRRRWMLPALRRTVGKHRSEVLSVFDRMRKEGESWDWAERRMKDYIDPTGKIYPKHYYTRIARTEPRRVVENAHLSGLKKAGFQQVQRLVTVDDVTDKDTCVPFENAVYPIDKSGGVIPAHPNCRCTFTAYIPREGDDVISPVPTSDILKPDVEGAEILDLQ
mgnify:CR=1 FL=1|tara:strand:+ start:1533 stop:3971 length:2439 start_codon:yes stop_codon:yes gene_type:complete